MSEVKSKKTGVVVTPTKAKVKKPSATNAEALLGPVARQVLKGMKSGKTYRPVDLATLVAASSSRINAILRRLMDAGLIVHQGYGAYAKKA